MPEIYHFFQQLVNGLTIGSTYALIAIGYTMVYGIIGMINFAHGEVYMIGSYVAFIALAGLAMMGIHSLPILMTVAFVATISSPVPTATASNGSPTGRCATATG
jgi:branched-chain amino acid transport system permease protein